MSTYLQEKAEMRRLIREAAIALKNAGVLVEAGDYDDRFIYQRMSESCSQWPIL